VHRARLGSERRAEEPGVVERFVHDVDQAEVGHRPV
jgi:hypothetical protein